MTQDDYIIAYAIAQAAHTGQVDKNGVSYIFHPVRVANSFSVYQIKERVVAILHDVIEDGPTWCKDAIEGLFPRDIFDAVVALTHLNNERREDYYARIRAAGELAVRVKVADIADNMSPQRLERLDEATKLRLIEKYTKAREELMK